MRKLLLAVLVSILVLGASFAVPPNVLIILADDCTFSDLPLYGGQNAKTPNLERLAAQNDPGIPLDTVEAHDAAKRGQHFFLTKP